MKQKQIYRKQLENRNVISITTTDKPYYIFDVMIDGKIQAFYVAKHHFEGLQHELNEKKSKKKGA